MMAYGSYLLRNENLPIAHVDKCITSLTEKPLDGPMHRDKHESRIQVRYGIHVY